MDRIKFIQINKTKLISIFFVFSVLLAPAVFATDEETFFQMNERVAKIGDHKGLDESYKIVLRVIDWLRYLKADSLSEQQKILVNTLFSNLIGKIKPLALLSHSDDYLLLENFLSLVEPGAVANRLELIRALDDGIKRKRIPTHLSHLSSDLKNHLFDFLPELGILSMQSVSQEIDNDVVKWFRSRYSNAKLPMTEALSGDQQEIEAGNPMKDYVDATHLIRAIKILSKLLNHVSSVEGFPDQIPIDLPAGRRDAARKKIAALRGSVREPTPSSQFLDLILRYLDGEALSHLEFLEVLKQFDTYSSLGHPYLAELLALCALNGIGPWESTLEGVPPVALVGRERIVTAREYKQRATTQLIPLGNGEGELNGNERENKQNRFMPWEFHLSNSKNKIEYLELENIPLARRTLEQNRALAENQFSTFEDKLAVARSFFGASDEFQGNYWEEQALLDPMLTYEANSEQARFHLGRHHAGLDNLRRTAAWLERIAKSTKSTSADKINAALAFYHLSNKAEGDYWADQALRDPTLSFDNKKRLAETYRTLFDEPSRRRAHYFEQAALDAQAKSKEKLRAAMTFFEVSDERRGLKWEEQALLDPAIPLMEKQFMGNFHSENNNFYRKAIWRELEAQEPQSTSESKLSAARAFYSSSNSLKGLEWEEKALLDPLLTYEAKTFQAQFHYFNRNDAIRAAYWFGVAAEDPQATLTDKLGATQAFFESSNSSRGEYWAEIVMRDPALTLEHRRHLARQGYGLYNSSPIKTAHWLETVAEDPDATFEDKIMAAQALFKVSDPKAEFWEQKALSDPASILEVKRMQAKFYRAQGSASEGVWLDMAAKDSRATDRDRLKYEAYLVQRELQAASTQSRSNGTSQLVSALEQKIKNLYIQIAETPDATSEEKLLLGRLYLAFSDVINGRKWEEEALLDPAVTLEAKKLQLKIHVERNNSSGEEFWWKVIAKDSRFTFNDKLKRAKKFYKKTNREAGDWWDDLALHDPLLTYEAKKSQARYHKSILGNPYRAVLWYELIANDSLRATFDDKINAAIELYQIKNYERAAYWNEQAAKVTHVSYEGRLRAANEFYRLRDITKAAEWDKLAVLDPTMPIEVKREQVKHHSTSSDDRIRKVFWLEQVTRDVGATSEDKLSVAREFFDLTDVAKADYWEKESERDVTLTMKSMKAQAKYYSNEKKNLPRALYWFEKIAKDPQATYQDKLNVAQIFYRLPDPVKGAQWEERAALDPSMTINAKRGLARNTKWLNKDTDRIAYWYEQAARDGQSNYRDKLAAAQTYYYLTKPEKGKYWEEQAANDPTMTIRAKELQAEFQRAKKRDMDRAIYWLQQVGMDARITPWQRREAYYKVIEIRKEFESRIFWSSWKAWLSGLVNTF